jgi:hypothetical protein
VASKNPCAKTVKPEQAYEVWQTANHLDYDGTWTWYVLKKYQSPEKEATNPYARWLCAVSSPFLSHPLASRGTPTRVPLEYGDTYNSTIKEAGAVKLDYNPLCTDKQTSGKEHEDGQL